MFSTCPSVVVVQLDRHLVWQRTSSSFLVSSETEESGSGSVILFTIILFWSQCMWASGHFYLQKITGCCCSLSCQHCLHFSQKITWPSLKHGYIAAIFWWKKNLPVDNPWVLLLCRLCHAQHRQEKEVKDKHVAHQSDAHSLRGWHWKGPRGRQESHDESRRAGTHLCRWHYLPCHSTPCQTLPLVISTAMQIYACSKENSIHLAYASEVKRAFPWFLLSTDSGLLCVVCCLRGSGGW